MSNITKAITYQKSIQLINDQTVHIIMYKQNENPNLNLLLSKVSEAILPQTIGNHIGEGSYMDNIFNHQKGIRFIINGGFNHYRKNFYDWPHQKFNVGDPVGLVKVREHLFEDYLDLNHYGFLVQKHKGEVWQIIQPHEIDKNDKYILGCTPLLVFNKEKIELPVELMKPMDNGVINPPSILGHGLQKHPRTAVGMKDNNLYFINVEGLHGKGCTLLDLQQLGMQLNLDSLLNLDGGGSSQFRLVEDNHNIIKNNIDIEDEKRILGHALIIFDETLKN